MLTVAFDASCALAPRSGVGRFTLELLKALAARGDVRLAVLLNSLRHAVPEEVAQLEGDAVRLVRTRLPGPALVHGWAMFGMPRIERLLRSRIHVAYAPAGYVPASRVPVIVTVHDAAFLREDPRDDAPLGSGFYRRHWPRQLPRCAAVATDSLFVAEDIGGLCGSVPVRAIPAGIAGDFLCSVPVPRGAYFLAVTSSAPRKRNGMLLDSFAVYRGRGGTAELRIVGWSGGGASPEGVRLLPRMSDRKLATQYAGALATVLTAREEGFGFPLLESFACGTPVIAGRHSSLAEIGGTLATWVREDTAEAFADALLRAEKEVPSASQVDALRQHAGTYTWAETARQYAALFAEVAGPLKGRG